MDVNAYLILDLLKYWAGVEIEKEIERTPAQNNAQHFPYLRSNSSPERKIAR